MARLLIVSNRLPVTVRVEDGNVSVERSAGGLATGLSGPHERSGGLWIGWPGETDGLDGAGMAELERRFGELRVVPVTLSADEVRRYYESFSNGVLWPLFHYLLDQLPRDVPDWDAYESANRKFAEAVVANWQPGDRVWVHDYQLLRVPSMIRERIPEARIGFFLHIPFPASDVFRIIPTRAALLEGMLGADLIGFHTASYLRQFTATALRVLGASADVDSVRWEGREVKLGVFPMGIDAETFIARGGGEGIEGRIAEIRGDPEVRLLVGIDRLDYTKGIPRRLLAFERLLQQHPELHEKARLVQVCVPSRTNVDAYQEFRAEVDRLVGQINGAFATPRWTPVHYIYRGLAEQEVVDLYRAADVMVVTPLRDGMNLVAKEFAASRTDEDGVLVLSEFAGAASELAEAVHVNPYDVEGMAGALVRALTMPADERKARMQGLRARVLRYDVNRWISSFLDALERPMVPLARHPAGPDVEREVLARLQRAPAIVLLLDYDGTLVPFAETPDLARPDRDLRELLDRLAGRAHTQVHVVSGRTRESLESWLGSLSVGLHAEHGLWSRRPGSDWTRLPLPDTGWRDRVLSILEDFANRTPGTVIERKAAGFSWHYRSADPEYGPLQARELQLHLTELLGNVPVEVFSGNKVIEVRPHGVHKGLVVPVVAGDAPADAVFVALGDDRTDDDLFAALPPGAIRVRVGPRPGAVELALPDPRAARAWLRRLL